MPVFIFQSEVGVDGKIESVYPCSIWGLVLPARGKVDAWVWTGRTIDCVSTRRGRLNGHCGHTQTGALEHTKMAELAHAHKKLVISRLYFMLVETGRLSLEETYRKMDISVII